MALKLKQIHTPYGAIYKDVYFKVNSVSYDDTTHNIYFSCYAWLNKEAKDEGYDFLPELQFNFNFPSENKLGNWWEESYNFIKKEISRVAGYTASEVDNYNQKRLMECMDADEPPTEMLIKELLDFVGCEDC